MITIPIHEIAQVYKEKKEYLNKYLMKRGQRVFVLKDDKEYEKIKDIQFQSERLYRITQFEENGKIKLHHHLDSRTKDEIEKNVKERKNELLRKYEKQCNIPEIKRESNEDDSKYLKRVCHNKIIQERLKNLPILDECKKKIKNELNEHKIDYSKIEPGELLRLTQKRWNFLYENIDFKIEMDGSIRWIND